MKTYLIFHAEYLFFLENYILLSIYENVYEIMFLCFYKA